MACLGPGGLKAGAPNEEVNRFLKNPDSRLFKKVQMRGAREIDERRRIY
jgi:hypothetical protein